MSIKVESTEGRMGIEWQKDEERNDYLGIGAILMVLIRSDGQ
jgi:hypothetical protein